MVELSLTLIKPITSLQQNNYPSLSNKTQYNLPSLHHPRGSSIPKTFKPAKPRKPSNKIGNRDGPMLQKDQLSYRDIVTESEEAQEEEERDEVEEEDDYSHEAARTRSVSLLGDEEGEEEDNESSTFLSLSEKPDRNTALLDDYETEELDFASDATGHRSGYVAVVGKPNVGKSTLSNQMVGQKLSIVTDKPQTTRHRILGICSGEDYQMILYDTPGVIEKKMHKLDSMMMNNVRSAAINADCVLVVVDACKAPQKIDEILDEGVGELKDKIPTLLVMNKKDLIKPGEIAKKLEWYEKFTDVDEVIPVSAKYGHGVDDVKDWILSKLPLGPAFYPKVNVISYKTRPNAKDFIQVEVVVEKNSQKIILIGKEGKALKLLATAARLDIEDFLQKKVFLEVQVKVKEDWRQNEGLLKYYGYGGQIRAL
ncbi:GTPase ERA-like, chloroplastic isoform X2 [Coffea arabica]|uniref:GTPase ERA-like, chloroplastic isoform X2 n=1 Tax=Coffea arabica TaxID=13443 RepID=A0ABM4V1Y0_COFAR